jgi:predicted regulator of Ras-like GTPase activity (Roadblock/LC7/MglB family)
MTQKKSISKAERSEKVDHHLKDLLTLDGVTTAVVVDRDGFVINRRFDFEIDLDALGAQVQIVYGSAQGAAQKLGQGSTSLVIAENDDGLILFAPFGEGFILAVVADRSAMLGAVRFSVKETVDEISKLL